MLKDGIELFQLQGKGDLEHAPAVEIAVRHKNVIMGIKAGEVAESLYGDDGAGGGILFGNDLLKKHLQGLLATPVQIKQMTTIIEKIPAQDFRDAEDELTVWHLFQHIRK
jgi:hypothetical protein